MIRRVAALAAPGMVVALALSCGGSAFTAARGGDDASMGDGPAFDGSPAGDAVSDGAASEAAQDSAAPDVVSDAVEEEPAHCSSGFQCVPAVPEGWTGPAELYLGVMPVPACPGASTDSFDGMEGLQAPAASCGCACAPSVVTCGASLATSVVKGCATSCATTTPVLGNCFTAPGCAGLGATGAFQTLTMSVTNGSCAPQATVGITPPAWKSFARACTAPLAPTQADCPGGDVCARTPSDPFELVACIVQAGVKACPATGYTQPHFEFTGLIDDRGCDPCTCGAPARPQCTGTLYAYAASTNGTCGGMADIYESAACVPTNARSDMMVEALGSGGACTASAGSPSGAATPTGATTICCTP